MIKKILDVIVSKPIKGESIYTKHIVKTTLPDHTLSFYEWCQLLKVSSMYDKSKP